jgi:V/A-type H+-transporting ATPase subunit K
MTARIATTLLVIALGLLAAPAFAADQAAARQTTTNPLAAGLVALGAALAVGLAALGTGIAQSRIGAAGAGTIAEKPDTVGTVILLIAIPETMVILGFVIAIILVFTL